MVCNVRTTGEAVPHFSAPSRGAVRPERDKVLRLLGDKDLTDMGVQPTSRTQRWRLIKAGKFPQPIKMGSRNVWREDVVLAWIAELERVSVTINA